ncbi:hypothetical protein [Sorangium sp. So ce128]|uniref:hypothetical protein n=1 Tax=Sorangium sp. So ce128 TaxID=3133281 RepID=UPI003F5E60A2
MLHHEPCNPGTGDRRLPGSGASVHEEPGAWWRADDILLEAIPAFPAPLRLGIIARLWPDIIARLWPGIIARLWPDIIARLWPGIIARLWPDIIARLWPDIIEEDGVAHELVQALPVGHGPLALQCPQGPGDPGHDHPGAVDDDLNFRHGLVARS